MAAQVFTFLCFLFGFVTSVGAWRCAKYRHYFSQQPDYIDCFWDCCGNSFNRHCCAPIGIIVGISILGAVVVAAFTVLFICWWQRRRARTSKGPKLFHNRRHSHYPTAPTSVTRPAPQMSQGPPQQHPGYPPFQGAGPQSQRPYPQRPMPQQGYRNPQDRGYDYDPDIEHGYRQPMEDKPRQQQLPMQQRPYTDYDSDRELRAGPLPPKQPPKDEYFM